MAEREEARGFDAFDPDTWRFEPAPAPWYRRRQALTAGIAVVAASAAIVVSGVLLVFDGSGAVPTETAPAPATTRVPTTAPSAAPRTAAPTPASTPAQTSVEPPAPAPPPAGITAEPIVTAPAVEEPPSTRATKEPEFGVTRTRETRRPISVAPNRPG
ncbi:hypothetical protein [Mycolicibacterium pulveris]|uniref:hypothetical protein n=1 Tax=Mycolicibacterium pulveris TaxID=36813 RepID=UPI003CED8160